MFATFFAVVTIDRWGRRVGLWWGAVGQGISLVCIVPRASILNLTPWKDPCRSLFSPVDRPPGKAAEYGGAAAFFIFLYTAIFGATWLTIPWVYPTEVIKSSFH